MTLSAWFHHRGGQHGGRGNVKKENGSETILAGSYGEFDILKDLKGKTLRGELGAVRCGDCHVNCPWVDELPFEKQVIMREMVVGGINCIVHRALFAVANMACR